MLFINKITAHETVDFAASELKKYLRMMMPNGGDVKIAYCPNADKGFRLALMQDLGLDVSDAADTDLDDILYIDADADGGIIAGDNPRSVLLAVYEFLRQNGCRWLFPGVDGEYIPMKKLSAVKYRFKPSMRYRGPCIEGATSQQILLDTLDFIPKAGMNVFQMQFFVPTVFYKNYYTRIKNSVLPPEPVSTETMLQWKTACEAEMSKRGIQFHDVGHGWTVAPFGIDTSTGWESTDTVLSEEQSHYLALVDGGRKLFGGAALNTQFCMSSPEARKTVAECIADYASVHSNVGYIHVWLGDSANNHCTCGECVKKSVSDWYVMLLNDIDDALSAKELDTRIVFIAYTETIWAPVTERIKNPKRFTLMLAPISRRYTSTLTDKKAELRPFVRNANKFPKSLDEYMAHFKEWQRIWDGACLCFEYHFWRHQNFEQSGLILAKRIYEDVEAYKASGIDGLIACGSQRSYFPTGFAYYVFARKQFDISLTFEQLLEEYFHCAFGEDWQKFVDYLYEIANIFGDKYFEGEESDGDSYPKYVVPSRAEKLRGIKIVTDKGRALIRSHYNSPDRVKTASVRVLEHHADFCDMLAKAFAYKADGLHREALIAFNELVDEMSRREIYLETFFDLFQAISHLGQIIKLHAEDINGIPMNF